jgi:SAM-dependent methyltransferase
MAGPERPMCVLMGARALTETVAEWSFRLRNALPWSAPAWKSQARSWERWQRRSLTRDPAEAAVLRQRHDLERWPQLLSAIELDENLYVLEVLDGILPAHLPAGRGLDVGSKNGAVLPALVAATGRAFDLVELDAHRRYLDLSTRRAHGERLAAALPGCRYRSGSVTSVEEQFAVVTWFLPFVHEGPLRAWGLPARFFAPEALLRHVCARVLPGGVLVVVNQGEAERDTQRGLFARLGLAAEETGLIESPLSPFRRPRYGFRWRP